MITQTAPSAPAIPFPTRTAAVPTSTGELIGTLNTKGFVGVGAASVFATSDVLGTYETLDQAKAGAAQLSAGELPAAAIFAARGQFTVRATEHTGEYVTLGSGAVLANYPAGSTEPFPLQVRAEEVKFGQVSFTPKELTNNIAIIDGDVSLFG